MNQEIRNKLRNVVTQCRKLLEDSITQDLEGKFGIYAKKDHVTADPNATMTHLSDEEKSARKDILDHFEHIKARGFNPKDALDQLIREIAFTHLNRFCAYKMMEAREVYVGGQKFREAVSRGVKSNGVMFYLADHPEDEKLYKMGQQDVAYRRFLDWLGGQLSGEIGVLFNPSDSANRLYPRQSTIDHVLMLLNTGGIKPEESELRDAWPTIWSSDETIGWVYQYFTPKELREQARKNSAAPLNSYELAFRNQFFTPRYVVQFLTDNTLGRFWYEMRKGSTRLRDQCEYIVRNSCEVFLQEGQTAPPESPAGQDEDSLKNVERPTYIPHRPKKDPRNIKILDPACGSGHFLLYCFDLLQTIYEEAYSDPEIGPSLRTDYPTVEELRRDIPKLILGHNLYGIDIDLRASQIAALALWLRCQRAFQELGVKKERPRITRTNFVCAEPMPGEKQLLSDFVNELQPTFLGQVVEDVFDNMSLAGEAGSLLRVEEKIRDAVAVAKKQWIDETTQAIDRKGQPLLFTQGEIDRLRGGSQQASLFDLSGITEAEFFERAEAKVVETLRQYAEKAQVGQRLTRRLFSDDAERGFAFVALCEQRYDVVLMNPPFGDPSSSIRELTKSYCPKNVINLLTAFVCRAREFAPHGFVGAITDSTWLKKSDYEALRQKLSSEACLPAVLADLGWGVLDEANVAACAFTINSNADQKLMCAFRHVEDAPDTRAKELLDSIRCVQNVSKDQPSISKTNLYLRPWSFFLRFPNEALAYETPDSFVSAFLNWKTLDCFVTPRRGYTPGDTFRFFRCWWEAPQSELGKAWWTLNNGSPFAPVCGQGFFVALNEAPQWSKHKECSGFRLESEKWFGKGGVGWGKRTDYMYAYPLPSHSMFSHEGPVVFPRAEDYWQILGWLNTGVCQSLLNLFCGQHKTAGYVAKVPCPDPKSVQMSAIGASTESVWKAVQGIVERDETLGHFRAVLYPGNGETFDDVSALIASTATAYIEGLRGMNESATRALGELNNSPCSEASRFNEPSFSSCVPFVSHLIAGQIHPAEVLQWCIGLSFGRWDIRAALSKPSVQSKPTDPIPTYSAGMLSGNKSPDDYPVRITWEGILADDVDQNEDICKRVMEVCEVLWPGHCDSIELRLKEMLKVKHLREYFRRTAKGGFWDDHVSRYTKSRRKAPIYWLLQSTNKRYALWLYYHRFDKDLLFKALVNHVEPKVRLETNRLATIRSQRTVSSSTKENKRLDKEIEEQEDFISELREFEDKLRRVANLNLTPDLNDGVVLSIAPLHELVPWKEAQSYWEELLEGKYEWSSIGKQLRQKGLLR